MNLLFSFFSFELANQQFVQEDPNYNSGENGHSISQLSNEPKQITTTTTTGTNEQRQQSARISATLDKRNSGRNYFWIFFKRFF